MLAADRAVPGGVKFCGFEPVGSSSTSIFSPGAMLPSSLFTNGFYSGYSAVSARTT